MILEEKKLKLEIELETLEEKEKGIKRKKKEVRQKIEELNQQIIDEKNKDVLAVVQEYYGEVSEINLEKLKQILSSSVDIERKTEEFLSDGLNEIGEEM